MNDAITIVSGLPRSGTSMMMKMLEAGGMPIVTDEVRKADVDNPRGYYELELVKKIKTDTSWLPETRGKVFKMVSMLLYHLPQEYHYRVICMKRDLEETLASQDKMLSRLGREGSRANHATMKQLFEKQVSEVERWMSRQPNISVIHVDYRDVVAHPESCAVQIETFTGLDLDIGAMAAVVDPALHRNRID